jgi:hypothetical protein
VNQARQVAKPAKPATVTEVIADGMSVVLARPVLLLIPLLIDLYYWLGWRVTMTPAVQSVRSWILQQDNDEGPRAAEAIDELAGADLTGIVSFFIPTLLGGADREALYAPVQHGPIELSTLIVGFLVILGLVVLASLLLGLFTVWTADAALGRGLQWSERLRRGGKAGLRFLGLLVIVLGLIVALVGPLLMIWTFFALVGIDLRAIVFPVLFLFGAGMLVLLYFAPEAIVVSDSGPIQAMRLSANVVRKNFWQTVGLAVASLLIAVGLAEIWTRIATSLPGILLALIANAFVGCGLAAAAILFFSQRWRLLSLSDAPQKS